MRQAILSPQTMQGKGPGNGKKSPEGLQKHKNLQLWSQKFRQAKRGSLLPHATLSYSEHP